MGIYTALVFLAVLSSVKACCDSCERDVMYMTRQLSECLHELTEKRLKLKTHEICHEAEVGNACPERLRKVTTSLSNCLESLCDAEPIYTTVKLYSPNCSEATTTNAYSIALVKMDGSRMLWKTEFETVPDGRHYMIKMDLKAPAYYVYDATHVVFNFTGSNHLFINKIQFKSGGKTVTFEQNYEQKKECCGKDDHYKWISGSWFNDKECNDYLMGASTSFSFFGRNGPEHVLNQEDFGLLERNQLLSLHRSCLACV
ncbi:hypothetical protein L596_030458 [Steinernema carpocapsae]|uniref:Uncharacterized protein n=1 Tax=Steinernema carpocapsae TaxID=34508 RepID=A0A4U5LPH1_STECR|nr:hypothetical protein L596_030458 [Steinernema carpocapsae]